MLEVIIPYNEGRFTCIGPVLYDESRVKIMMIMFFLEKDYQMFLRP